MVPSLYTEDNITSLMSQLDEEENLNLFDIVKFLNFYDSRKTTNTVRSQEAYKNAIASYGELISKIDNDHYKCEVKNKRENNHGEFDLKHSNKIPHHRQMIDKIKKLSNPRQKEVKYLAWYILYYKIYKLDINDRKRRMPIWQRYSHLIEQIKCLPINERI